MRITDIISPETIQVPLEIKTKEEIISDLIHLLEVCKKIDSREEALSAVIERERCMTTGIGKGLAIPHGKCGAVETIVGAMGIANPGIDFAAMDKKPVEVVVLIVSNPGASRQHLHIISLISRIFKDQDFKSRLVECRTSPEVYETLKLYEEEKNGS